MSARAKQLLQQAVEQLPDDATVEDAMERLYLLAKIARGMEAVERGEIVSHAEVRREFLGDEA